MLTNMQAECVDTDALQSPKGSRDTKERLTREAIKLFVRRGYAATTIDNIVHKVGLTKGAFYSHFVSKAELLLSIVARYKACYLDEIIQLTSQSSGNAISKLNEVISFNARFAAENKDLCVFLTFLSTELTGNGEFQPALKAVYKEYTDFLTSLIEEGIVQGLIKKELDPRLTALTFIALHGGSLHQWIVNHDTIDGQKFVSNFRDVFFSGIIRAEKS